MSKHRSKKVQPEDSTQERPSVAQKAPTPKAPTPKAATPPDTAGSELDQREERLFRALDLDNDRQILRTDFYRLLEEVGLRRDDHRLRESLASIEAYLKSAAADREEEPEPGIPQERFGKAIRQNILLIERALQGNMVIPDFADFCLDINELFDRCREVRDGKPADYIPELDLKEPEVDQFGLALCTIDGQRHAVGDAQVFFPIESTCKPVSYCLALEEHGEKAVHDLIGHEPSGLSFNELTLDKHNRPHNPLINSGAILSSALIKLAELRDKKDRGTFTELEARGWSGTRFDKVLDCWSALSGDEKPRFSTAVYLSERATADRNFALAYYMREKGAFPSDVDLHDVLDFYFQCCSIEMTCEMLSVVAATLANGGICPTTGQRVFKTETVQNCLALMSTCGMYEFSGEFAFTIGLPAKSGVSGVIIAVVPNVMGCCIWSPRIDERGNSVRGLEFCRHLVRGFNFHNFDTLTGRTDKRDPRVSRLQMRAARVNELIWAASKGDLGAMQDQEVRGADLGCADYDLRTPLHLAAAENQVEVVEYFVARSQAGQSQAGQNQAGHAGVDLNPLDRWGGTPLDDAYLQGHDAVVAVLEAAGGRRGTAPASRPVLPAAAAAEPRADSDKAAELIWAASVGDLRSIRRLVALGVPLDLADYDRRTPLHLAAAEGHAAVVQYFVRQGVPLDPLDRWGHSPLDDAERHGCSEAAAILRAAGAA